MHVAATTILKHIQTAEERRRHIARETQYKRGTQFGASKEQEVVRTESKTQCKRRQAENYEYGALKYRISQDERGCQAERRWIKEVDQRIKVAKETKKSQTERRCQADQGRAERGGSVETIEVAEIGQR